MKVLIADRAFVPHQRTLVAASPPGVKFAWVDGYTDPRIYDEIADADVFAYGRFDAALAAPARRLQLIHATGTGTDGIDRSVVPSNTRIATTGHHESSMAEYIAASLVTLRRGILAQDAALRTGRWLSPHHDSTVQQTRTLRGCHIVFLGFGGIGQAAWQVLQAFGCEGIAITRRGDVDPAASGLLWAGTVKDLPRALDDAEILIVSIPHTSETTAIIGADELSRLGADAVIVNVARGPIVDQQALFDALTMNRIGGAVIDVWYRYPDGTNFAHPADLPFGALPHVLMTPHTSASTTETFHERALDVAENITRLHAGQIPRRVVQ